MKFRLRLAVFQGICAALFFLSASQAQVIQPQKVSPPVVTLNSAPSVTNGVPKFDFTSNCPLPATDLWVVDVACYTNYRAFVDNYAGSRLFRASSVEGSVLWATHSYIDVDAAYELIVHANKTSGISWTLTAHLDASSILQAGQTLVLRIATTNVSNPTGAKWAANTVELTVGAPPVVILAEQGAADLYVGYSYYIKLTDDIPASLSSTAIVNFALVANF